jgi:CheY-like chemotaxis protein
MPRILIIKGPGESFLRLTNTLSQAKYDVFEVESGEEALEFGPSIAPDLVLVSIVLPNWNGLEVAARLRTVPGFESIKIILLGHVPPIAINDEPLASLVNGYLDVNLSAEELVAHIETQLATST